MKLLLDTHVFIWWDSDPVQLSATVRAALKDPANTVTLSVVSVWESVIKRQMGKFSVGLPLATILTQQQANGVQLLSVELNHVLAVEQLPALHKAPFDRLLIAQTLVEGATMVTADAIVAQYPVQVLW